MANGILLRGKKKEKKQYSVSIVASIVLSEITYQKTSSASAALAAQRRLAGEPKVAGVLHFREVK